MASFQRRNGKVRVQIRKEGTYVCRTFAYMADAKRWATQQEAALECTDLPTSRHKELRNIRLGELIARYAREVTPTKKGRDVERRRINLLAASPIVDKTLAQLTPRDFSEWRDNRLKAASGGTVRRDLSVLRRIIEVARTEWHVPLSNNPLALVRFPDQGPPRTRRLAEGELERLLAEASPIMGAAIQLLLYSGMRRSELVAATWANVNWKARTLRLQTSKNGETRFVPLSNAALDVLRGLPQTEERIIPLSTNALRLAWQRLKKRTGVEGLRMHDLRREAASRAFEKGLGIESVMVLTGHKTPSVLLKHYTALKASEVAAKLG